MRKEDLKAWFAFTKKERNAVIVLVVLVLLFFYIPHLFPVKPESMLPADTVLNKEAARLSYNRDSGYKRSYPTRPYDYKYPRPLRYNNAYEKQYPAREQRYPGASDKQYAGRHEKQYPDARYPSPNRAGHAAVIDINNADSLALLPLPGIGPWLAGRIIGFRDKLGGFYEISQVAETYGLPDSTFQLIRDKLKIEKRPVQIDINTVDINVLKQHPYIRWQAANAIIQYRLQHGNFQAVEDLLKIHAITPEAFQKMAPYLSTKF